MPSNISIEISKEPSSYLFSATLSPRLSPASFQCQRPSGLFLTYESLVEIDSLAYVFIRANRAARQLLPYARLQAVGFALQRRGNRSATEGTNE